jgi:putative ABC transport system substrate-binding protein
VVAQVEKVIGGLGAELIKLACPNDEMVTKALGNLPQGIDAIFLVPDSVVNKRIKDIVKLTVKRKLPLSGPSTAQIEQGAFMTYGFVHTDVGAQAARMAHLIIKGAKPAELPVESAESYLGLNLATSKSIGVEIPGTFLRAAKVVIRTSER